MANRTKGKLAQEVEIEFDHTKGRSGVWVCKDGTEYAVTELEDSHLKNIYNLFFGVDRFNRIGPLAVMENADYQIRRRPVLLEIVAEGCRRHIIPGKILSMLTMLKHEVMLQEGLSPKRGRAKRKNVLNVRVGSELPVTAKRV